MRSPADSPRASRSPLYTYLGITFLVSWAIQAYMIHNGRLIQEQMVGVLLLMWTPALASVLCRIGFRQKIFDVSFRIGKAGGAWPWMVAWLQPVMVGLLAYGTAWLTGLVGFAAPKTSSLGLAAMAAPPRFLITLGISLTIGVLFSAISALGEEIGWRGYMLTRLVESGIPHPILLSGLIWGLWHVPLIVSGQYAAGPYPLLSAILFLISIIADGAVTAFVRLETGSLWAAVVSHAAWNSVIQGPFDSFSVGGGASRSSSVWIGESGILVVISSVIVAYLLVRKGMKIRSFPRDDSNRSLSLRQF